MLNEINAATKSLQYKGYTESGCREYLDLFLPAVNQEKTNLAPTFYRCKLGCKHISRTSSKIKSPLFESGVPKLQKGLHDELQTGEKEAVSCVEDSEMNATSTSGAALTPIS